MLHDMTLWAQHYGIPLRMPSRFPIVTLRAQRALCTVERLQPAALSRVAQALFRAYWADDQDPTSDEVIASAARSVDLDPALIVAGVDAQETKDLLRATTDEAVKRGAFGAPTMFVGDVMFWGNDRIPLLEQFLAKQ
jgi:2-hydroxychromene-2-carboxylate isomerase